MLLCIQALLIILFSQTGFAETGEVLIKAKLMGFTKDKIEFMTVDDKRFLVERTRIAKIDHWVVGKAEVMVPLSFEELEAITALK